MADYQILWTRQEEHDPKPNLKHPPFVHILEVGVANSKGEYLGAWTVSEVIKRMDRGDQFFVMAVLWDRVHKMSCEVDGQTRQYIQTSGNGLEVTNLKNRHQHGPIVPEMTTVVP